MKKIISILILCLIAIASVNTIDGQTKRKSSKTSSNTSQSVLNKIPSFSKISNTKNSANLFKNLGYSVSKKQIYDYNFDEYVTATTATLTLNNGIYIRFEEFPLDCEYRITINGNSDALNNYYTQTKNQIAAWNKEYRKIDEYHHATVKKSGNTIFVGFPCD